MESLYNYLLANYKENEPILSASLSISGISPTNMRQQLKKLTDSGKLKRFDSGVYYLPKKSWNVNTCAKEISVAATLADSCFSTNSALQHRFRCSMKL